jgi:hypothetical protein
VRTDADSYSPVFLVAGVLAVGAALLSLAVATNRLAAQPAAA